MKTFEFDDGGRLAAGYKGTTGDCVVRAVAIAAELDYKTVYRDLANINLKTSNRHSASGKRSPRNGIFTKSKHYKKYMESLGFKFTATMGIGTGCTVHLRANELPVGRIICHLSKHSVAVIDGVIHDISDPRRGTTITTKEDGSTKMVPESRCVYGYWSRA